jgi:16S rRNA (adenine1518-N6/adenine1519-N6)-dimethyltransferase
MGQNFLIDENIAQKITNLIHTDAHDAIIEIGPGGGILTQFMVLYNKPLVVIELDKRLAASLTKKFDKYKNFALINNDVLKVNLEQITKTYVSPVLLSNLPYSISSPMMLHFIKQSKIKVFICMLQKEMADRISAMPGTKSYNALSALVQWHASVAKMMDVSPNSFDPPPAVDSCVVEIQRNNRDFNEGFAKFLKICFTFKRKTLMNNLKQHFSVEKVTNSLNVLSKSVNIRAEELSPTELFNLYESL